MGKSSAGLLLYRVRDGKVQILAVHPGGPLFARRDAGVWSIPKGEPEPGEDLLEAARREFAEETGLAPAGPFLPLEPVRQKGGKVVHAWAVEGDWDPSRLESNMFRLEWPPGSGRIGEFPEIDRAEWLSVEEARRRLNPAQVALVEELVRRLEQGTDIAAGSPSSGTHLP
jgi:predicted NUDIX family NTP pyrophosphohydrolase